MGDAAVGGDSGLETRLVTPMPSRSDVEEDLDGGEVSGLFRTSCSITD
jgi:hypothetical protein